MKRRTSLLMCNRSPIIGVLECEKLDPLCVLTAALILSSMVIGIHAHKRNRASSSDGAIPRMPRNNVRILAIMGGSNHMKDT